jgi:malic enzyme
MLVDPLLNKGSAFSQRERIELGLEGLLPPGVNNQAEQARRAYAGITSISEPLLQYRELMALQDRNEYLFYRVLIDHLEEFMPIVYTPTVGEATQKFSNVFQRGRGLWITPDHRGRIKQILQVASAGREVRLMVVTDNESILGIGDQGAGGMAISIGKLALYIAGSGIPPHQCLPISLDVGTDNQSLLDSDSYLGLRQPRLRGPEYDALVAEFVDAVEQVCPTALVQWEDFRKDNALQILETYRDRLPSFNDDIQGTGAVALAGIFSALRATGQNLTEQRIVVFGAGAAGLGISRQIGAALRQQGLSEDAARARLAVLDSRGLLVSDREIRDEYKRELAWSADQASAIGLGEDRGLEQVVKALKPTVLIGTSGQAGAFGEASIRTMAAAVDRPLIMPLSNPTSNCEAVPEDLLAWTDGRALIATGSPFAPVRHGGKTYRIGQGNNVFIFPALGMATLLAGARVVTDNMITRTASALAEQVNDAELEAGLLYPDTARLRAVTAQITAAVIDQAIADGVATHAVDDALALVAANSWEPHYPQYCADE